MQGLHVAQRWWSLTALPWRPIIDKPLPKAAKLGSIRLTSKREWSRSFSDNDIRQHECSFGERVRQVVDGLDSHGPSFRRRDLRQGEAQDENESRRRGENPGTFGVLHIV